MKRPDFSRCLLPFLAVALGCQSTKSEETASSAAEAPVAASSPALVQAEVLAKRFGPIIQGAWVNADYLAAVQKSRSPLQAADAVGAVSEIHINPAGRSADSLVLGAGFGNHEGGSITVYFRPGQQSTALPTNYRDYDAPGSFAELSYQLGSGDTNLLLTTYGKNRQVLARTAYRRVSGASPNELNALNLAVRRLLAARYAGADSLGRPAQLEFMAGGQVKGLKGFRQYDVATDFAGGPVETDYLLLDNETRHRREMAFRQTADSLLLYSVRTQTGDVPTLVRGRPLFRLVKRR